MPEVTWRCLPCGTTNYVTSPFCDECGSPRPGPTRWPAPEEDLWPEDFDTVPAVPPPRPPIAPSADSHSPPRSRNAGRIAGIVVALVVMATGGLVIVTVVNRSPKPTIGGLPAVTGSAGPTSSQGVATVPSIGPSSGPSGSPSISPQPSASVSGSAGTPFPSLTPPSPRPPRTTLPAPPPGPTPTLSVGLVDVRAVNTNPHVLAVGGMYDAYFSSINVKNYAQALALYDPTGSLNPSNPAQAAQFTHGVSTTVDSRIVLQSIADNVGDLDTRITFQSQQDPGFGPAGVPSETCTLWDNTYQLRPAGDGSYRIFKLLLFAHHAC